MQATLEQRSVIGTFREVGYSKRQIAAELGISCKCIHYTVVKKQETIKTDDRKRLDRPKTTSSLEDNFIRFLSKRNRRLTASQITVVHNNTPKPIKNPS